MPGRDSRGSATHQGFTIKTINVSTIEYTDAQIKALPRFDYMTGVEALRFVDVEDMIEVDVRTREGRLATLRGEFEIIPGVRDPSEFEIDAYGFSEVDADGFANLVDFAACETNGVALTALDLREICRAIWDTTQKSSAQG